jgi:puromycin-sensitive aminopeptidase
MSKDTAVVEPETETYRLPRTVTPSRYEIKLAPDLQKFKFDGEVTIHASVHEPVRSVVLNALELEIQEVSATAGGTRHEGTVMLTPQNERMTITFPRELAPGSWSIKIKFVGTLNDKLHGFYRSTYKDANGNQKVLATTQFEATDARRAFPCFDEPDFKASFKITLVVDEGLTAISNAGIESEKKLANKKKEVVFKETIKMSTYLVAFIVGELEGTTPVMADSTPIRVWCAPGKKNLAHFAQGIARHSLTYFANYFSVPYAGDKLDLIAIPDFAFGAMENMGAVTFRETALLVDEKAASHAELERIADVVAHEIAHMWFGDLTTMSWWNGIWLNEAFATFAEMMAVDAWKPDWKRWDTFGASRAAASTVDGLESTRPIEYPVRSPEECHGMFDVLTYEKGASVLRQLEQYITPPMFQKGMSIYLNRHKFANTQTDDLWKALEEASREPVVKIMDSWIFHQGYPLVTVELDPSQTRVDVSQQRFFYTRGARDSQLFQVPLMVRAGTDSGVVHRKLLLSDAKVSIDMGSKVSWVVVNEGGHGFYRVRYGGDLLSKLTARLYEVLAPVERFNLVNDSWAMVLSGHMSLSDFLKMARLFKDEMDKNVWSVLVGALAYLDRVIGGDVRSAYESYVRELAGPALARLGWEPESGEDELTRQLRGMIIGMMGSLGNDAGTQKKAAELYSRYKGDNTAVDPDVVPGLVSTLASSGDAARYEEFLAAFRAGKTPQEEERYLYALSGFKQPDLLQQTLQRCLSSEVRTQNAPYLLRNIMMNVHGSELAWNFAKQNWDKIMSSYPDNSIARMCEGITALVSPELEADVQAFFREHPVKQGMKTVAQHMERQRVAVAFKQREAANFRSCFS